MGEPTDDEKFYIDLISDMDLETALAAAEDEGLVFDVPDIELEDAKKELLAHYCPGLATRQEGQQGPTRNYCKHGCDEPLLNVVLHCFEPLSGLFGGMALC